MICGTKLAKKNHLIESEIRGDTNLEAETQYQETVETAANMISQPKQGYYCLVIAVIIFHPKNCYSKLIIPSVDIYLSITCLNIWVLTIVFMTEFKN